MQIYESGKQPITTMSVFKASAVGTICVCLSLWLSENPTKIHTVLAYMLMFLAFWPASTLAFLVFVFPVWWSLRATPFVSPVRFGMLIAAISMLISQLLVIQFKLALLDQFNLILWLSSMAGAYAWLTSRTAANQSSPPAEIAADELTAPATENTETLK